MYYITIYIKCLSTLSNFLMNIGQFPDISLKKYTITGLVSSLYLLHCRKYKLLIHIIYMILSNTAVTFMLLIIFIPTIHYILYIHVLVLLENYYLGLNCYNAFYSKLYKYLCIIQMKHLFLTTNFHFISYLTV